MNFLGGWRHHSTHHSPHVSWMHGTIPCLRSLAVPFWTFWGGCEPFPPAPGEVWGAQPLWDSRSWPGVCPAHLSCRFLQGALLCAPLPPTPASPQLPVGGEGEGRRQALGQSGPRMEKCGACVSLPDEGNHCLVPCNFFEAQNGLSTFFSDQRIYFYVKPY